MGADVQSTASIIPPCLSNRFTEFHGTSSALSGSHLSTGAHVSNPKNQSVLQARKSEQSMSTSRKSKNNINWKARMFIKYLNTY